MGEEGAREGRQAKKGTTVDERGLWGWREVSGPKPEFRRATNSSVGAGGIGGSGSTSLPKPSPCVISGNFTTKGVLSGR